MKLKNLNILPTTFILDIDGVFTDGAFYYTSSGKYMKRFGAHDHDALFLIQNKLNIHCITGDKRGYAITKKRINEEMQLTLDLVSTFERISWIKNKYDVSRVIYMADGIFDPLVFKYVAYSIAPNNAFYATKPHANFVTKSNGGEGAVAEACIHILQKFFHETFDPFTIKLPKGSGNWKK